MDLLDLLIVLVALIAAVGGYRLGFIGRVISWLGLAVGLYIAVRFLPSIVVRLHSSSPGTLLTVAVLVLVGGAMIGQGVGLIVGSQIHHVLPWGPLKTIDRTVGAAVGALGVFAMVWMLVQPVSEVPGWPSRSVSGSAISRWISRDLPTPPDTLQVLRRLIGNDAPQVFAALQDSPSVGPVPTDSSLGPTVTQAVANSTVEVEGQACDEIFEGSGFAVAPDLIVTNAHVVAGEPLGATSVILPSRARLQATVVMFDPRIDIALLAVPSLGETPLPLAAPTVGAIGAVFGHPNGQAELKVTPARIVQEEKALGRDLYDDHTTTRQILVLASALAHGDSGGALVNAAGDVVGVAFAISADQSGTAYALNSSELKAALAEIRDPSGMSTGPCLTS